MTRRRESLLITNGLLIFMAGALGWLIYRAAGYLVRHSEIEIRLSHAGFGFISASAEMIYSFGSAFSVVAGMFFGLLGLVIYVRRAGSFLIATVANVVAAALLVSSAGADFLFPLPALAALCLWLAAVLWVLVHSVALTQPGASGNNRPTGQSGTL